ncbi:MAG: ester cyclase [Chloroflexi bacterium]|nr:ester cyclase [Chloroflexota bacterium]
MSEQNKALVRRLIEEVIGRGDFALIDELVAADYVGHSSTPETYSREGHKQFFAALRRAFPDLQITVEDQIAEGDKVVTRWTARGTHEGEFAGIPPTGKRAVMTGIYIDRFADGKLVECWTKSDDLGLLQQLGVIPVPAQTA